MMFKNMVKDFKNAKKLYGDYIVRKLTGYDPSFAEKTSRFQSSKRRSKRRLRKTSRR